MIKELKKHVESMEYKISKERGLYTLDTLLEKGYDVQVQRISADFVSTSSDNYIVNFPGIGTKKIVIGAHYDKFQEEGKKPNPGADDNASGCSALLALIDNISEKKFNKTLEFVFFCSEEPNYVLPKGCASENEKVLRYHGGSRGYLDRHPVNDIFCMLNLDVIGRPSLRISDRDKFTRIKVPDFLISAFKQAAEQAGIKLYAKKGLGGSDFSQFLRKGIPATLLTGNRFKKYWHTTKDTSDKIDYNQLEKAVILFEKVIKILDKK